MAGDMNAAYLDLPPATDAPDVPALIDAVLKAVASAEITPTEGGSLASIIGKLQSAVTLTELEGIQQQIETGTATPLAQGEGGRHLNGARVCSLESAV